MLSLLLGYYLYYYFYPNNTRENILNNARLEQAIANDGLDGLNGTDGSLGVIAIRGLDGLLGQKGEDGQAGRHSLVTGASGATGAAGFLGPHGAGGKEGLKGVNSDSIVPRIFHSKEDVYIQNPIIYEHEFVLNNTVHKLTGSFLFEDVTNFSFIPGDQNRRFMIDTSAPGVFQPITVATPSTNIEGRRIYSSVRIILERKERDSDGTVFYASAPIQRDGFLLKSDRSLIDTISSNYKLDELTIDANRNFGLDFDLVPNNSTTHFHNYLVGGLLRYRSVFNIDPPEPNIFARIEERFSSDPIIEFPLVKVSLPLKVILLRMLQMIIMTFIF